MDIQYTASCAAATHRYMWLAGAKVICVGCLNLNLEIFIDI